MRFAQENSQAHWHINKYQPGEIVVNNLAYQKSILLHQDWIADWPIESFEQIRPKILEELSLRNPELILIGTGSKAVLPSREILNFAQINQISLEIMSTSQACRTYNLMASDGRNILAALIVA